MNKSKMLSFSTTKYKDNYATTCISVPIYRVNVIFIPIYYTKNHSKKKLLSECNYYKSKYY